AFAENHQAEVDGFFRFVFTRSSVNFLGFTFFLGFAPAIGLEYAGVRAVYPASRPNTRNRPMRSCEPTVVRCRLIASVARVIAVEKPMQYSVPWTSLSIVLGIAMSATTASARTCE